MPNRQNSNEFDARVAIVAVPNGFNPTGDKLCVSLQITPAKASPEEKLLGGTWVDIREWPKRIADLASAIQIEVTTIKGYKNLDKSIVLPNVFKADYLWNANQLKKAQELWEHCFPCEDSFRALIDVAEAGSDADTQTLLSSPEINTAYITDQILDCYNSMVLFDLQRRDNPALKIFSPKTIARWALPGTARDPLGQLEERQKLQARLDEMILAARKHPSLIPSEATDQKEIISEVLDNALTPAMLRAKHNANLLSGRGSKYKKIVEETFAKQDPLIDWLQSMALAITPPDIEEPSRRAVEDQNAGAKRAARRRLAAILSFPSLAKFLGLAIDVEIPIEIWNKKLPPDLKLGALRVSFDSKASSDASWSAFVRKPNLFHPCDMVEALPLSMLPKELQYGPEIVDGVVDLTIEEGARYSLKTLDVVTNALRLQEYARDQQENMRRGEQKNDPLPELAGRGIVLNDSGRFDAMIRENKREEDLAKLGQDEARILFAGDLLRGYKVSVALVPRDEMDSLKVDVSRWRSIMARTVRFDEDQVDQEFMQAISDRYLEREFAHVRPLDGHDEDGKHVWTQELFGWHGDSLALPAQGASPASINSAEDLNVGITFSAAKGFKLPPLRDGCAYLFGMVPSYVNGCSLSFAQAAAVHSQKLHNHVLGAKGGEMAYVFKRCERIPPPVLLLPPDERLVTQPDAASLPGETIDTLVIRSGDRATQRARRYLFPERIAFDRAEQQDQFRHDHVAVPRGAFRRISAHLSKKGEFPLAFNGSFDFPQEASESDPKKNKGSKSRGLVMSLQSSSVSLDHEYYCDRYSQSVRGHIKPVVPSNSPFELIGQPIAFWEDHPRDARPIMLEAKRGPRRKEGESYSRFDPLDKSVSITPADGGANIRLSKLTVELAPATDIELNLVTETNAKILAATHLSGDSLLRFAKESLEKKGGVGITADMAASAIGNILAEGQVASLQGGRRLRLVHAVQRPLDKPMWDKPEWIQAGSNLKVIWQTVLPPNASREADGSFTMLSMSDQLSGEQGGLRCYFVGNIEVDAPSTGSVRCEAKWRDHGSHALRFDSGKKKWHYEPKVITERLFSITELSSATTDNLIELTEPKSAGKHCSYAFGDGRARRLALRFIGTSRFESFFSKPPPSDHEDLGFHEAASPPFEQAKAIWVPCNFQPPPPTIRRITPVFDYTISARHRKHINFERTTRLRLDLGEDCFITGEDERIALCFYDAEACELLKGSLAPYATGITRWGSDPLHNSPVPTNRLAKNLFERNTKSKSDKVIGGGGTYPPDPDETPTTTFKMPIGVDSKLRPLNVEIIDHAIRFDPWSGFYCDLIPLSSGSNGDAFMPFVHLGLVRYQRHAISGLELSPPVGRDVQLIPPRKGSVRFTGSREFELKLSGHTHLGGNTPSVLDIRLLRRDKEHDQWIPALDRNNLPVEHLNLPAQLTDDHQCFWKWLGASPRPRWRVNYGLLIEEFEQFFDTAGNIERRRLVFSITLDFNQKST